MINFILFVILFYRSQFFRHMVGIALLSTMLWWYGHQNTQTNPIAAEAAVVEQQESPSIAAEAKINCC